MVCLNMSLLAGQVNIPCNDSSYISCAIAKASVHSLFSSKSSIDINCNRTIVNIFLKTIRTFNAFIKRLTKLIKKGIVDWNNLNFLIFVVASSGCFSDLVFLYKLFRP